MPSNNRPVEIRPFASNLIEKTCPVYGDPASWAISFKGERFTETEYACDDHVGDLAANIAKRINA